MAFVIKRFYDPASPEDGARVLVDRLWPRGVSKERAALTEWMKAVAPSSALREWFDHCADRMDGFDEAYRKELVTDTEKQAAIAQLLAMAKQGRVTLLYAAKDPVINHARVLKEYLDAQAQG